MTEPTVTIPLTWLQRLMVLGATSDSQDSYLLGYIESAKTFLPPKTEE